MGNSQPTITAQQLVKAELAGSISLQPTFRGALTRVLQRGSDKDEALDPKVGEALSKLFPDTPISASMLVRGEIGGDLTLDFDFRSTLSRIVRDEDPAKNTPVTRLV